MFVDKAIYAMYSDELWQKLDHTDRKKNTDNNPLLWIAYRDGVSWLLTDKYREPAEILSDEAFLREAGVTQEPDMVEQPAHYALLDPEPRHVLRSWYPEWYLSNAIKYIVRCDKKGNKLQDLQKAIQYLKFEIDYEKKHGDK